MPTRRQSNEPDTENKTHGGSATTVAETIEPTESPDALDASGREFVGQWRQLVSTTNWEKGRIIAGWRAALEAAGAAATQYSDEAWAQLVGGVTSQHVGRLRRVWTRFGEVRAQYEGLYWSHFQAAIDWDDAEMWLEGALVNRWSVSQVRGKRWETLGNVGELPADDEAGAADEEMGDDVLAGADDASESQESNRRAGDLDAPQAKYAGGAAAMAETDAERGADSGDELSSEAGGPPAKTRARLPIEVDELPSDLAEAFESFKLAIIAQRRSQWRDATPAMVIDCLDALRELTLAPSDD